MKILTLSAVALSLFIAQPLFAEHGQCSTKCDCPYMKHLKGKLSLTPAQKNQMKVIKAQAKPAIQKNKQMIQAVDEKIRTLTKAKTLNQKELDRLVSEKSTLLAERMKLKANMRHQIYNILTPAQQAKFNEMEKNWKKDHKAQGAGKSKKS